MKGKQSLIFMSAVVVALTAWGPVYAQQKTKPQTDAAGFLKPPGDAVRDGVIVSGDAVYLVRGGAAKRVDAAMLPAGQLLTVDGELAPLPENISGLGATGPARATAGSGSTAAPEGARPPTDSASPQSESGLVMHGGAIFLVRNGEATRLDATTVPNSQMMTFEGEMVPVPEGVAGLPASPPSHSGKPSGPGE